MQLTFQIIDGEHQRRLLWTWLNLEHPTVAAVRFGHAELSAICRAAGVLAPKDSVELHNLPLVISVRCKKRTDTGEIVNEIKGYAKRDQPSPAAYAAAPMSNSKLSWKRS